MPLVLGLDRARLSKRHGATSVLSYRDDGYLPQALNNYLVRLGWSHGDQEIFTHAELIEAFSLDALGSSAGVFNPEKLEWVNAQHLKRTPTAELAQLVKPFIAARGWTVPGDDAWLARMVATLQERAKTLVELVDLARLLLSSTQITHRAEGGGQAPRQGAIATRCASCATRSRRCRPGAARRSSRRSSRCSPAISWRSARSRSRCASRSPAARSARASSRSPR